MSALADANTVINGALKTSAKAMAAEIASGQLDYMNRAQIEAEAQREVGIVSQRVQGSVTIAQPIAGALVANLMVKVDDKVRTGIAPVTAAAPATPAKAR